MTNMVPAELRFTFIHELVVKSRLVNLSAVADLSTHLRYGKYCLILGARFSEKSFLLDDIATALAGDPEVVAIRVDLAKFRHDAGARFISRFATEIATEVGITDATGVMTARHSERQLVQFLEDVSASRGRHVILLLDHLELLPVNDIDILLRALRSVFTEQRGRRVPFPLTCAATTSFAVAKHTIAPTSPFNEGHQHWVGDLDCNDSRQLFANIQRTLGVDADEMFFERLFAVTSGDRYLIALLGNCCAEIAAAEGRRTLSLDDLEAAEKWFLERAESYPPLQETVRALEQPDVLRTFMQVLRRGRVEEKDLEVRGDEGPDALRLTGGVRRVVDEGHTFYEARNDLVRRHMVRFYNPVRVARVLFMAGRVTEAVEYLEEQANVREDPRLRRAFLDAVASAINAALTVEAAVKDLARHLVRAFGVVSAAVYIDADERGSLDCVSAEGPRAKRLRRMQQWPAAFREGQYKMKHETKRLTLVLTSRTGMRFGIIDIHGFEGDTQTDDFSQILSVVRQIGWALGNVFERERLIRQLKTLDETGRMLSSSLDLKRVLEAVVEAGIKAVPGAERGLLLLYDENQDMLLVESQSKAYQSTIRDEVRLRPGQGYAGTVFETGEPAKIDNAPEDPRVLLRHVDDVAKQKSVVCVPLFGWERTIGVFILDNITEFGAFRVEDQGLLSAFAAQAATALQNAMVYRGLYDLSIKVNRGHLSAEDIFLEAARSIVHVTGAFAANLLLLRDTDDAAVALASRPLMSVAHQLSERFQRDVQPRPDGITFCTLQSGKAAICSSPEQTPGIHPLALAEGVRALIALPLSVQERIRGVMFVHYREPHEFSPDEQYVLSIFANLCAEAIEETRHAEQLRIHGSVAWMGLDLSETVHSIAQLMPPLQNYPYLLKKEIAANSAALLHLNGIEAAVAELAKIPAALLPLEENIRTEDIANLVRKQVDEWTKAHKDVVQVDLSGISSAPAFVQCDARRMSKVVKCLTENAVRAARRAEKPWIRVGLRHDSYTIEVVISNSGDVIPSDVQAQLFRKPVRSSGGGRGVGLLIARSIVIGYDGDLELVHSADGETTFRLSLPGARKQEAS